MTSVRFWCRWLQPSLSASAATSDYRPLTSPPNAAIVGWWCSGYASDDTPILCALVVAEDEVAAREAIKLDWPEADFGPEGFVQPKEADWLPGDRFPLKDWMLKRTRREP